MGKNQTWVEKPSLIGMIFKPVQQFERIHANPTIWLPLLIPSFIAMFVAIFVATNIDYMLTPELALSEEGINRAKMLGITFGALGAFFGLPISYIILAAVLFFILRKSKPAITFKQMFSFIILIGFISVIGQCLNQIINVMTIGHSEVMVTSLNKYFGAEGALGGVLGEIELFTIWYYILLAIGLIKVARLSKKAATTISIVYFCLLLIIAAVNGVLEQNHLSETGIL